MVTAFRLVQAALAGLLLAWAALVGPLLWLLHVLACGRLGPGAGRDFLASWGTGLLVLGTTLAIARAGARRVARLEQGPEDSRHRLPPPCLERWALPSLGEARVKPPAARSVLLRRDDSAGAGIQPAAPSSAGKPLRACSRAF